MKLPIKKRKTNIVKSHNWNYNLNNGIKMEAIEKSIISWLLKNTRKKFTIEDLAKRISSKRAKHSRASVFRYCNKLLQQNILKSEDIGRIKQITLKLNNDETLDLIAHIEIINNYRYLK